MDYYGKIAEGYDELYGEEQRMKLAIIQNSIKTKKSTKILDIGCGTGISSNFECFVAGIDPSRGLLKQNKSKRKVLGAAESLPFRNNVFDYVVCMTAIHNFHDVKKSLEEMKRVCDGAFAITILRRSKESGRIKKMIEEKFKVYDIKEEDKDVILFCRKPAAFKM